MILLVETSELPFEPAIEGRSDRSAHEVPSGVLESLKSVLAPIRMTITAMKTDGGGLCGGADVPRPKVGRFTTWRRGKGSCLTSLHIYIHIYRGEVLTRYKLILKLITYI
jgi:hypothetical protein